MEPLKPLAPQLVFSDSEEITSVSAPTISGRGLPRATPVRDRASLTLVRGPNAGAIHSLLLEVNVVGRGKESTIRIDDPGISRAHARIVRVRQGTHVIEDLGSRNGTFVNGQRVVKSQVLAEADRVGIGLLVELRFSLVDELEEGLLRSLYESSVLDALTGAFNRKHFVDRLTSEIAFARRHKTPLSLIIFDLDHFKRVNDTHGHLGGDHVLRAVANLVKRSLRTEDVFARYGGEEFAIIARGIDVERAYLFAERLRNAIADARIEFNQSHVPVTVSLGVGSLACCENAQGNEALVAKADERLYRAKGAGRNRTVAKD